MLKNRENFHNKELGSIFIKFEKIWLNILRSVRNFFNIFEENLVVVNIILIISHVLS